MQWAAPKVSVPLGAASRPDYGNLSAVSRPTRFEHNQYVGDKRSRFVHDLDASTDACAIDELMASEQFAAFGPDSLPEARNRGYRPHPPCTGQSGGGAPAVASNTSEESDQ